MSRFLPSVAVADTLKELEVPAESFRADFAQILDSGVKRLYSFQNQDGGWGWFSNDGSSTFMSAYVVYGLARAKKAGVPIDQSVIDRGVECLRKRIDTEQDNNMLAYTLFALATAGAPQTEKAKSLAQESTKLSSYSKALLALALSLAGEKEVARSVLAELEKEKIVEGEKVHFETEDWFYKWEDVSIETTAYALKAFLEVAPESKVLPGMVVWLISRREGNRWHTTKDSAAAIYGLIEYVKKCEGNLGIVAEAVKPGKENEKPEFLKEVKIYLNEKYERKVILDINNPTKSKFVCNFDSDQLQKGVNHISFDFEGTGLPSDLACFATLRYTIASRKIEPASSGLTVRTSYSKTQSSLPVEGEVSVTVEVTADADYDYLIIASPIPAGASLVRGSQTASVAGFEERFDQAIFYVDHLAKGTHTLGYKIRCNHTGEYSVAPASATLMYNTNITGSGESLQVAIK